MIALDTNVLVRFLVDDDRRQASRARSFLAAAIAENSKLYVSEIVVCELVWVLESAYGFGRKEIVAVLRQLLNARHVSFRSSDRIDRAVEAYDKAKGDLADYLIRADAFELGCTEVITFDKALLRESGFRSP